MAGKTDLRKLEDRVRRLEKKVRSLSLRVESLASSDLEAAILEALAQEWETVSPPGILDITELAERLEEPISAIKEKVEALFERGSCTPTVPVWPFSSPTRGTMLPSRLGRRKASGLPPALRHPDCGFIHFPPAMVFLMASQSDNSRIRCIIW